MARKWWTQSDSTSLLKAQDLLLSSLVKSSFTSSSSTAGINSVTFTRPHRPPSSPSSANNKTVVLAHGFGSGLGFFYANVDRLFQQDASTGKVTLVDWLGMGGSERPSCRSRPLRGHWSGSQSSSTTSTSWCDSRFAPSQACQFFVDPFHAWTQETTPQTDELVLMGHSHGLVCCGPAGKCSAHGAWHLIQSSTGRTSVDAAFLCLV
jgi:pimeloyl-ACP methyl ester carboxylesterase